MPRPIPVPIRRAIFNRWRSAQPAARIARELSLPQRTARHPIKRSRDRGETAVPPDDRPKGHDADPGGDLARLAALAPRGEHPPWGAPLIRDRLLRDHPAAAVPSARSLQRLFRRQDLARPPRPERPTPTRRRPERPHEAWQVDASEAIPIATGEQACWLRVVDKLTGAVLLTRVFPREAMDERPGRADRRGAATGLRAVGTAGPAPGGQRPSLGLGRRPADGTGAVADRAGHRETAHDPPARPQANDVVERSQEIGRRWSDAGRRGSAAEVRSRLDAMDTHQREWFPEPARSRLVLFPKLAHSGRAYAAAEEAAPWARAEMRRRLAEYAVERLINSRGLISVYGRNHHVGKRNAGRSAYVRLDVESGDWLFELTDGPTIGRTPAGLSRETILSGKSRPVIRTPAKPPSRRAARADVARRAA